MPAKNSILTPVRKDKLNNNIRDLDPNVLQNKASDPDSNVWVGASAGTGKTKVLTDRVLRLLLPQHDGRSGSDPRKILCLTFTKAGANEMALRINKTLSRWTIITEQELHKELNNLFGKPPTTDQIQASRRLFATIVDTPGGIQIMTIHAFCQSVLARFPLESQLSPNFTLLDEKQAGELLSKAMSQTLNKPDDTTKQYIKELSHIINEDQFFQLLQDTIKERNQLRALISRHKNIDGIHQQLCSYFSISAETTIDEFEQTSFNNDQYDFDTLKSLCQILADSPNSKDQERLEKIQDFIAAEENNRHHYIQSFASVFLTTKDEPRKSVLRKPMIAEYPHLEKLIEECTHKLLNYIQDKKKLQLAKYTKALLTVCSKILSNYKLVKDNKAAIDFDDLIIHTYNLLERKSDAQWVLFKLDQRIEHILIDEAQDTNPDQWKIIEALCSEFYDTLNEDHKRARTVFVVGDEKQSIYSFQRASPEEFERMRKQLKEKALQGGATWNDIALNISFRTTKSILQTVDKVFEAATMHKGLGEKPTTHNSYRRGQAGLVEIWPIIETTESSPNTNNTDHKNEDFWSPPVTIKENSQSGPILANKIARSIAQWIRDREFLPSRSRPIKPGDIMILFRTRTALAANIIKELKNLDIPVSGADRMVLHEQIVIQDLLALASFTLLPEDDLTLATLLKSPLFSLSEAKIYNLSYNRAGTLWDVLRLSSQYSKVTSYLKLYINESKTLKPLDFFNYVLKTPCLTDSVNGLRAFRGRLGDDILDPIQEFLDLALDFEYDNIPTLQNFVHWMNNNKTTIKREMENNHNAVRIMTVHASKGLQAPIVILPDTIRNTRTVPGQSDKRLLWPSQTGLDVPMWSPNSNISPEFFQNAYNLLDERLDEEYRRLLYVAMTRAEDRLYIAGHTGKRKPLDDSWYFNIHNAMQDWDEVEKLEDGTLRLTNPQTKDPDRAITGTEKNTEAIAELPDWINNQIKDETAQSLVFRPSTQARPEPAVISPLQQTQNKAFARGNIIHALLQFLPDIKENTRKEAAQNYLKKNATDFTDKQQNEIFEEIFAILDNPDFTPYFSENSQAEVPITGITKDGQTLSGQIDRLVILEDSILILDFKTNRPPPTDEKDVPLIYRHQMKAYRDTIRQIYPDKDIRCALLWTYTLQFMELKL